MGGFRAQEVWDALAGTVLDPEDAAAYLKAMGKTGKNPKDCRLSAYDLLALLTITMRMHDKEYHKGFCYGPWDDLSRLSCMSANKFGAVKNVLREMGLIDYQEKSGRYYHVYRINWDLVGKYKKKKRAEEKRKRRAGESSEAGAFDAPQRVAEHPTACDEHPTACGQTPHGVGTNRIEKQNKINSKQTESESAAVAVAVELIRFQMMTVLGITDPTEIGTDSIRMYALGKDPGEIKKIIYKVAKMKNLRNKVGFAIAGFRELPPTNGDASPDALKKVFAALPEETAKKANPIPKCAEDFWRPQILSILQVNGRLGVAKGKELKALFVEKVRGWTESECEQAFAPFYGRVRALSDRLPSLPNQDLETEIKKLIQDITREG